MSKSMPKNKNKSKINYNKIAKELKGKVSFKIDLRKVGKKQHNTFNFGQRMALLKSAREYAEYKNSGRYIPIQRKAGESKTGYKKRLRQTKKDHGQKGNHFTGVFSDSKSYSKIKTKRIRNSEGIFTTEITSELIGKRVQLEVGHGREDTRELYIPVDSYIFMDDYGPSLDYIETLWNRYPDASYIMPMHSGHRGTGADKSTLDKFAKKLTVWAYRYEPDSNKAGHWLSGFLIVWRVIVPEKGAMGKRIK